MKKLLFLLIGVLLALTASAQWTVQSVPNTRLQGNWIHVSDPDGYLSDSVESVINAALDSIRDQADVFVVTVYSIGDAEPKHFATELFNYWGIGDSETDNGVLLLFVEDQRALEFETGYGAEATLTDALCSQIFNRTIVPYFKAGDYEGGLCAGVDDIVNVYSGVDLGYDTFYEAADTDVGLEDVVLFFLVLFMAPVAFISFMRWLLSLSSEHRKKAAKQHEETFETQVQDGINYITGFKSGWSGSAWVGHGFRRFMVYGVGGLVIWWLLSTYTPTLFPNYSSFGQSVWFAFFFILGYNTWICVAQSIMAVRIADAMAKDSKGPKATYKRVFHDPHTLLTWFMAPWVFFIFLIMVKRRIEKAKDYRCPICDNQMEKDEAGWQLPEGRAFEQQIGAFKYVAYRCPSGHRFVGRENGRFASSYQYCSQCGVKAVKLTSTKTLREANYSHDGLKENSYVCEHCNHAFTKSVTIPKLTRSSSSSSYHSSGRSYSSHSHGSFGGGHSGGGGYSGRW